MSAAEPRPAGPTPDEKIDEAVEESFPASDPPAFQAGATGGAPDHQLDEPPRRNAPVIALIAVAAVLVLVWALFG